MNRSGERIRLCIHEHLCDEVSLTIDELHYKLSATYEDHDIGRTTPYNIVKGLNFSYKMLKGRRYIIERADLVRKRSAYLSHIQEVREREDLVVYMDETWVFEGMVQKKGWVDESMSRFTSKREAERYSYGKTAGKGKGRRAIVVAALSEEGVVPGTVLVVVTGRRSQEEDYHKDMDARMFEEWLRTAIPCMRESAEGRSVTLVLDNAPYHTCALNQVPQRSSTKEEIRTSLSEQGVDVAADSTKSDLLDELDAYVASRGGRAVLRQPAAESICQEMGIRLLRLPPLHCFFNPVELCWNYLKHSLNKVGKPSDKIELVRRRTLELLNGVTRNQCEGWLRETIREDSLAAEETKRRSHKILRQYISIRHK